VAYSHNVESTQGSHESGDMHPDQNLTSCLSITGGHWGCLQAVGDALSGVLMVEAALRRRQWGLQEWGQLYQDLPSRQSKVLVANRSVISTINAETQVAAPAGLQALIDHAVAGKANCLVKGFD